MGGWRKQGCGSMDAAERELLCDCVCERMHVCPFGKTRCGASVCGL